MFKKRSSFGLLSTLALAIFGLTLPVSALGAVGVQPGLPRQDEPRTQSIFIHTVKPSDMVNEKLKVTNGTDATKTIAIYPVDAIATNTGSFTCKQHAENIEETGTWIQFSKSEVTLGPNQTQLVDFTITVPQNAEVGEHNACVALEVADDPGTQNGSLRVRTRSAIRVVLTVPGDLHRNVSIRSFDVAQQGPSQRYDATLHNDGNVSADTKVAIRLVSLFGFTVYQNGGEYPVLANKDLKLTYNNNDSPFFGGWYVADAEATYDQRPTAFGTRDLGQLVRVQSQKRVIFIMPQPLAAVILVLVLIGLAGGSIVFLQRKHELRSWQQHIVDSNETLQDIAAHYHISWRRLANVNKLKAPYAIKPNTHILVPPSKTQNQSGHDSR